MNTLIESIIYLVAIVGIIVIIGSIFEMFVINQLYYFKRFPNKIINIKKNKVNKCKSVRIDIYLNNIPKEEIQEIIKKIKENKSLTKISDYINIYIDNDN